jgi:hypothetical protein
MWEMNPSPEEAGSFPFFEPRKQWPHSKSGFANGALALYGLDDPTVAAAAQMRIERLPKNEGPDSIIWGIAATPLDPKDDPSTEVSHYIECLAGEASGSRSQRLQKGWGTLHSCRPKGLTGRETAVCVTINVYRSCWKSTWSFLSHAYRSEATNELDY